MLNQAEELVASRVATGVESSMEHDAEGFDEPENHEVSGVLLRALADVVQRYGVSPEALFEDQAFALMTCEPVEVRVPLSAYRTYLSRAIALTGEPGIGLRAGLDARESAYDLVSPLIAHVPSLRHAIREIRQFQPLFFGGAYLRLTEQTGIACLRWEFPRVHAASDRSIAEFFVGGTLRLLQAFGCARSDIHAAYFEHRTPAYYPLYATFFEGAERFSSEITGIEFAAQLLDRPHLHGNPGLQSLVRAQAEQRLARVSRPTNLVDRIRVYLRNQPASRVPDMSVAARDLGVSVRSLRRRLTAQGLSYRALTQELQRDQACAMLRNADFTLHGVAYALGFADPASFHRAFKRWTGLTPCEYQNAKHLDLHPPVDADDLARDVAPVIGA